MEVLQDIQFWPTNEEKTKPPPPLPPPPPPPSSSSLSSSSLSSSSSPIKKYFRLSKQFLEKCNNTFSNRRHTYPSINFFDPTHRRPETEEHVSFYSAPHLINSSYSIRINIRIWWAATISFNITLSRDSTFEEFTRLISDYIGYKMPKDLKVLYNASLMTSSDREELFNNGNPEFVKFLTSQYKLRPISSEEDWTSFMKWFKDEIEVTLFAESKLVYF